MHKGESKNRMLQANTMSLWYVYFKPPQPAFLNPQPWGDENHPKTGFKLIPFFHQNIWQFSSAHPPPGPPLGE